MAVCGEIITTKKGCGKPLKIKETPDLPHKAKILCPQCGFRGWQPKDKNKDKKRRGSKKKPRDVFQFHNQEEKRCFFCRRLKEELGANETFTVDHIHELDYGGKDEIENMQVLCKACHTLKNHQRLYHNRHQQHTTQN